eukprot:CCRYP_011212-RA/>CCRYP_011212-RA protein AED:0.35 eAED:0.22 QI:0/-1/0/1/-1/1/1/0/467
MPTNWPRLCQGVGTDDSASISVQGTDTSSLTTMTSPLTDASKSPTPRLSAKSVQKIRPRPYPYHHRRQSHLLPGDIGTRTAPLKLVKLMINSVLSRHNAKFCTFDISNFYLGTPLDCPEYVRIRIHDIPQEFIANMTSPTTSRWMGLLPNRKGCLWPPQSGILANKLLETQLNAAGYYQLDATPGLWRHKWRPVMFTLIVDDFGIEYIGLSHAHHLQRPPNTLDITQNWKGISTPASTSPGITQRSCRLTMKEYIATLLFKYNHPPPKKHQLSPFKATPSSTVLKPSSAQTRQQPSTSNRGHQTCTRHCWRLLYYARAVDNKLLHALSDIGTEQASATSRTTTKSTNSWTTVPPILTMAPHTDPVTWSYLPTRCPISMPANLAAARIYIMCSENDPVPSHNGPVLTITQIIKFVTSSAAESELAALFICAKEWSLSGSPSLKWDGHNPSHPSKPITPLPWVLPTKPS